MNGVDYYTASYLFAVAYGFNPGFYSILAGALSDGYETTYATDYLQSLDYHWGLYPYVWAIHDYRDPTSAAEFQTANYSATTCDLETWRSWLSSEGIPQQDTWITETGDAWYTDANGTHSYAECAPNGETGPESYVNPHTRVGDAWAGEEVELLEPYAAHVVWYGWYNNNPGWDSALDAYGDPDNSDGYYGGPGLRTSVCVLWGESVQSAINDTTDCGGGGESSSVRQARSAPARRAPSSSTSTTQTSRAPTTPGRSRTMFNSRPSSRRRGMTVCGWVARNLHMCVANGRRMPSIPRSPDR